MHTRSVGHAAQPLHRGDVADARCRTHDCRPYTDGFTRVAATVNLAQLVQAGARRNTRVPPWAAADEADDLGVFGQDLHWPTTVPTIAGHPALP